MLPIAALCHSVWWAFAAAGAGALLAAVAAGAGLVPVPVAIGTWQVVAGILVLIAARRASGGIREALPVIGIAAAGAVLGIPGLLLPTVDPRIGLIAIGIWGVVAAAGYLAISQLARARGVRDGGLYAVAWVGLVAGAVVSTLPAFGVGWSPIAVPAALAITGAVTLVGSDRLRVLPAEPPPVLSKRGLRRRERAERTERGG